MLKKLRKEPNKVRGFWKKIRTDICGLFPVKTMDGYDSFITFIDNYSRYGYIYPIKE
jgi:hypothetical protein